MSVPFAKERDVRRRTHWVTTAANYNEDGETVNAACGRAIPITSDVPPLEADCRRCKAVYARHLKRVPAVSRRPRDASSGGEA